MDIMAVVLPETHVWAVFVAWIACYVVGSRFIAGGSR